jgi:hypothetical protein
MNTTLTIKDETNNGKVINEINISVKQSSVTIRDIIEARVQFEVDRYNEKLPEFFQGLVQPTQAEKALNGFKMKERKKIDFEKQFYIALDAFQRNGYFVLVDNKQSDSLEQVVAITPITVVSFIKLTPLVGG